MKTEITETNVNSLKFVKLNQQKKIIKLNLSNYFQEYNFLCSLVRPPLSCFCHSGSGFRYCAPTAAEQHRRRTPAVRPLDPPPPSFPRQNVILFSFSKQLRRERVPQSPPKFPPHATHHPLLAHTCIFRHTHTPTHMHTNQASFSGCQPPPRGREGPPPHPLSPHPGLQEDQFVFCFLHFAFCLCNHPVGAFLTPGWGPGVGLLSGHMGG